MVMLLLSLLLTTCGGGDIASRPYRLRHYGGESGRIYPERSGVYCRLFPEEERILGQRVG